MNEKGGLIKGGYSVEFFGSCGKKVLWKVVYDHGVEEGNDSDEIGLRRFDFNLFEKDEEGVGREGLSEYPYLLILMDLWPGDWKKRSKRKNMKVGEGSGKNLGMVNGRYRKVRRFSKQ